MLQPTDTTRPPRRYTARNIALAYLLVGALWIFLTDRLVAHVADHERWALLSTYKGWLFIAVTGILLYVALGRWLASVTRSHRALAESEERFVLFMRHLPALAAIKGPDGRYLFVNSCWEESFGHAPGLWTDRTDPELLPAESVAAFAEGDRLARAGGKPLERVERFATRGGVGEWLVKRFPIPGKQELLGVIALDVTERRRLEEMLLQAQKMEAVGRLAGGVAHDFNNLLTVICGYAQLLVSQLPAGDSATDYAEAIVRAGEKAAGLTRQLLAFSRKQVLQPKVLDVNILVSEAEKMLRRVIPANIAVEADLDPEPCLVRADPAQLDQVILNLALNARDAMPSGGALRLATRACEVTGELIGGPLSTLQPGLYVRLSVTDTGHGMDPETRARIFEPFFTTKKPGKGTGLGLSIVYGVAAQSGGGIHVETAEGSGTSFHVYLPRAAARGAVLKEPAPPGAAAAGAETILLAEDEPALRDLVADILREAGYRILSAANAEDAIAMAESPPVKIDLLLTDIVMPGMSGQDLAHALTRSHPLIRVIYMSGYADSLGQQGVLEPDVALLRKPFLPADLLAQVRGVLDKRGGDATSPGQD